MSDQVAPGTEKKSEFIRGQNGGRRPGAGRPAGSQNKATIEVKSIAQTYGKAAIEKAARLAGLVTDEEGNPAGAASSEQAQLSALSIILDRAYGKAPQALTGEDGGAVKQVLEIVWQANNGRAS